MVSAQEVGPCYTRPMLLAVDTGGTKTLVTGFDRSGKPTHEFRFETPKNPNEYLAELSEVIHKNFGGRIFDAVVVAIPGIVRDNVAVWCDNLAWENVDVAGYLQPLVNCPVWLANDAKLAGLAETRALATTPANSLYITVSTGIGTGIIINGQIMPALSISEGGHMLVEYDGIVTEWENFASGAAIKRDYGKFARDIHDKKIWREIADKISRGLLVLIPVLQPEVIIIGGSIGTYFERYEDALDKVLTKRLPSHIQLPAIRQAIHPEEAVLYGCYYYGSDQLATKS
jgi:predicted NBD/HSP70 family sugar kinase